MLDKEQFDWKLTIKVNILMLKMAGLWPKGDETYEANLYTIYAFICVLLFIIGHVFFQTVNLFFILDDLQAVTGTIFILLTDIGAGLKTYCLMKNMALLKELMITLNSDLFQPKSLKQKVLVQPSLNFWKTIYKLFWTMAVCALLFFAIFPIVDKSVMEYRLPFLAWYPFNTKTFPAYEITYVYQVFSICFIAVANSNIDTLIAALCMYTGTQFDLLCDDLRNLNLLNDIEENLIKCVIHHKEILRFAADFNNCFNWIIFLQFFTSAITIAMTMFQLTVVAPLSNEFYSLVSFGNAILVEIFMYCWFGNEVEVKSGNVPYAVFQSDWTDVSLEVKRHMIFFVLRCQRPLKISALNLFYLSLETFVKILRTAWSYFALLHQVNSRD